MSKLDSVLMNSKEMKFITGGDANIPMKPAYKNKESCKSEGAHLLDIHVVKDMTIQEIAEEIFAHAIAYYKGDALQMCIRDRFNRVIISFSYINFNNTNAYTILPNCNHLLFSPNFDFKH